MNLYLSDFLCPIFICSLLLLLLLTNCSSPPAEIPDHIKELENLVIIQPNSEPAFSIEFTRETVIDDSDATRTWFHDVTSSGFAFGGADWFAGLEIDDSGRIYVGNHLATTIQVFDSTGLYLANVGREGNGPGEFNGILDINIQSNQLYAFDSFQFRTTFFSLDSLEVDEVKNAYLNRAPNIDELTGWHAQKIRLVDADTFLVGYMDDLRNSIVGSPKYNMDKERPVRYYLVDREGKVLTEMFFELMDHKNIVAVVEGRHLSNLSPVPFLNTPLISISSDGQILSANSEESLIKMYDSNGDYLRAFYLPIEKKIIVREELIELYGEGDEENENLLQNAEPPEKWPALGDIVIDDKNRLWISTIPVNDNLTYEWWVLQETGELLAKFRWPGNRSIEKIKDGYLYARETEESTGMQTIVKYRVKIE